MVAAWIPELAGAAADVLDDPVARNRGLQRRVEDPHDTVAVAFGDPPVAIVIVDAEERVRNFLPQLDELVTEEFVIMHPVEVIR